MKEKYDHTIDKAFFKCSFQLQRPIYIGFTLGLDIITLELEIISNLPLSLKIKKNEYYSSLEYSFFQLLSALLSNMTIFFINVIE